MALVINTNVASLGAQRTLNRTTQALQRNIEKLSSGYRVNRAADDAAGLGISENLRASIRSLAQASRNANDGISMLQVAEAAMNEQAGILTRLRELAVQSSNGVLGTTERSYIDTEAQALVAEVDRIAAVTEFNGVFMIAPGATPIDMQVGLNQGDVITVNFSASDTGTLGAGLGGAALSTLDLGTSQASAQSGLSIIDQAITDLSTARSTLGATQNRLDRLAEQYEPVAREAQDAAREAAQLPQLETVEVTVDSAAADRAMQDAEQAVELARAELSSQEQRRASLTARCEALRSALTTDGDTALDASWQHGSLDSLIRVRPGYEKAVAVLLGAHARASVLREDVAAGDALAALAQDDSVRFVLGGTPQTADSEVLTYIEAPDFLRGALAAILRGCHIVQSLEQASAIVGQDPQALVATVDGRVLGRGTAGQGSEAGNVIALRNALEQATEELVSTEACWQRAVDHLSRVEAQSALARQHRDDVRAEAAQEQARAAAAAERDVHVRQRAAATARRLEQITAERDEVSAALQAQITDLENARTHLAELTAAGAPSVDRTALEDLLAAQERARHAHHEASLNARSAQERHRALQTRHTELQEQTAQAHEAVAAAARRRIEREQALVTLGRLDAVARRGAALVEADARTSEQHLSDLESEQATLQERHTQARTAALELAGEVDRLTLDVHRDEVLRAGKRATLEQLTEKALEEYGLTVDDLVAEYGPEQMIPGAEGEEPHAFDREVQQRRLKEAERGLALLGRVNPLARAVRI